MLWFDVTAIGSGTEASIILNSWHDEENKNNVVRGKETMSNVMWGCKVWLGFIIVQTGFRFPDVLKNYFILDIISPWFI